MDVFYKSPYNIYVNPSVAILLNGVEDLMSLKESKKFRSNTGHNIYRRIFKFSSGIKNQTLLKTRIRQMLEADIRNTLVFNGRSFIDNIRF